MYLDTILRHDESNIHCSNIALRRGTLALASKFVSIFSKNFLAVRWILEKASNLNVNKFMLLAISIVYYTNSPLNYLILLLFLVFSYNILQSTFKAQSAISTHLAFNHVAQQRSLRATLSYGCAGSARSARTDDVMRPLFNEAAQPFARLLQHDSALLCR